MMFLGRYQLGREVPLYLQCVNASGVPADPEECPTVTVISPSGAILVSAQIPVMDRLATTGFFAGRLFLTEAYSAGNWLLKYHWVISGSRGESTSCFQIVPGGVGSGQILSLFNYDRPPNTYLVQHRASGRIYKGKNPIL